MLESRLSLHHKPSAVNDVCIYICIGLRLLPTPEKVYNSL
jgi:hypothetical protein